MVKHFQTTQASSQNCMQTIEQGRTGLNVNNRLLLTTSQERGHAHPAPP